MNKLSQRPSLIPACNAVKSCSAHWEVIGQSLNVPLNFCEEVRNSAQNCDWKLEQILDRWLETQEESATWSALINALRSIGLNCLAMKIKEDLMNGLYGSVYIECDMTLG